MGMGLSQGNYEGRLILVLQVIRMKEGIYGAESKTVWEMCKGSIREEMKIRMERGRRKGCETQNGKRNSSGKLRNEKEG